MLNNIDADALNEAVQEMNGHVDQFNDLFVGSNGAVYERHDRFPPIYGHMVGAETSSAARLAVDTYNAMKALRWNSNNKPAPGEHMKLTDEGYVMVMAIDTSGMPFCRRTINLQ